MEVPVQRCPQHHGYLPSWTRWALEVVTRGIRNRGDEKVIIVEGRAPEGMNVPFPLFQHATELCFPRFPFSFMLIRVVLRL